MFYKILDDYIELYKLNGRSALDNMKSHYDCEEEYWAIIEELLDRYIELQSKIDKAIEYIENLKNFKIKYVMLEEKKIPEKLNKQHFHNRQRQLANKINEIINYLDYLKSKGE